MNPVLPDEVVEFAHAARAAFADLGGVDAARAAEDDPARRAAEVAATLHALGIDELDARADADSLAAAAALCEEAGRVALPYPVAGVLLRDEVGRPFAVVPDTTHRVDHGDLFAEWTVAALDGTAGVAAPKGGRLATRLGPFVVDLEMVSTGPPDAWRLQAHTALTGWTILGTAARAVELAVDHVSNRIQFGKPIASFQAVQFQLADAAVAVSRPA